MSLVLGVNTPYWLVVVLMILVGLGFGPAQSLYALAVQNSVPPQEIGQATSTNQFTRQIGSTIGAAVMGTIFSAALGAAFLANLPSAGGLAQPGDTARRGVNSKGLAEMRGEVESGFDRRGADIERLFSLRGEEAGRALAALEADSSLSAEFKASLAGGTPAMQIDAAFLRLGNELEAAVDSGKASAVETLLASPRLAGLLSEEQKSRLLRLPYAPPGPRAEALRGLRSGLATAADRAVAAANAAALGPIRSALESAKKAVADEVVSGMRKSFSDSIHRVWTVSIVVMLLMLTLTLLIPNVPLRSRNDYAAGSGEEREKGGAAGPAMLGAEGPAV
jgi:hypothetical protein